ncbi:DNA -binding domain-containing protein [Sphingomonas oligophenolica]|uniref:DNA -binding domain-containing protein n=1 Tax=Sphingomonas oligophenolica TaxID=301154 RepID=UPI003CD0BE5D
MLSDGFHRIRLDVAAGSLAAGVPVILRYELAGIAAVEPKLLPLRRLLYLCRHRRFAQSLFVRDARMTRWILLLRVHDAEAAGATQRDIAGALYGIGADWRETSDSLRSRVRRLVRDARAMAAGGYRRLLRAAPHQSDGDD